MSRISPQAQRLKDAAANVTGHPKSFFTVRTEKNRYGEYGDAHLDLNIRNIVRKGNGLTHRDVHENLADHADDLAKQGLTVNVIHSLDGRRSTHVSSTHNPRQEVAEYQNGKWNTRSLFHDRRQLSAQELRTLQKPDSEWN
jgi:hypothetical protein